jgi:hypothetical protein
MKLCQNCGQLVAEEIISCPSCGSEVGEGREYIDDYRIVEVLHEGYSSILCRAVKEEMEEPVMIRIFTPQSGVDAKIANRLKQELEKLKDLPEDYFVRHLEIRRSSDGLWYRVSEWIDGESWGALLASGRLQDYRTAFDLFYRIASILQGLHQIGHFIPHLILDDIIVFKGQREELEVKIDYKLSRFLDPRMDQPGPMLKKLLSCHPDIINNRPLDFRSDIWSLGKIFVELLTADHEATDFQVKIDELPLPHEVEVLFKIMLTDDPDLRPRSMAEVAETLARVEDKEIEAIRRNRRELTPTPVHEIRGIKKRISLLAIIMTVLVALGGFALLYFTYKEGDSEATLKDYANQYAGSVAFLLVEYWLDDGENIVYRNKTEGTAFLVDKGGYLLTNRHVACPWLEDSRLFVFINRLRQFQRTPSLGYRIFLWFEGEKAFKRLPGLSGRADLDDIYFLESAFSTDKIPRLIIAGVARPPIKTWQLVKSPLKDDFAVLKIDRVPDGLNPLPLDLKMETLKIPRLSPVITLGFPLGSQTQATTVNVSVTRGHVRRTFENLIQVDTSIHRGNSGGPIIDIRGKVIGIASSVAMDWATGPIPVATLLSDMGMVLPITKAAAVLQDLKAGHIKWNGVLDLSIDTKLKQITKMAGQGRWVEAQTLADKELELSFDPALVMAAGMMHFCSGDHQGSRHLFGQALSLDDENDHARLMLFFIDWLSGESSVSPYRQQLLALDWRSSSEFFGHLVRVLEGLVNQKSALKGGYSESERSWLHYVASLILSKQGDLVSSESLSRKAVLAADIDDWVFFLSLSWLEQIQRQRLASLRNTNEMAEYQAEIETFSQTVQKSQSAKAKRQAELAPLITKLQQDSISPGEKQAVLEKILESNKTNGKILVALVYYGAMNESWDQALEYARAFLEIDGRENAGRLSIGLLQSEILHNIGRKKEAKAGLERYNRQTQDPWYRAIGESLLAGRTEKSLTEKAVESPKYLITAHTALGFWAEGSRDKKKAVKHYKEALGSYMDDMLEYEFAKERIKRLKQVSE